MVYVRWTLPPTTPNCAKRHSATWTDWLPYVGACSIPPTSRVGSKFDGQRIPLINPQRGIFKPRQMEHLLSIKTVFPRKGARVWYDDQRDAHHQIYAGDDVVDYAFMGTDPNSADNRWLRDAMQRQIPVIYLLGTSPGRYQPISRRLLLGGTRIAHGSSSPSERS